LATRVEVRSDMTTQVPFSTFLDAYGANLYADQQYQSLLSGNTTPLVELFSFGGEAGKVTQATAAGDMVTVGLVLDHNTDPSSLLSGNWAQRQAALGAFADSAALWAAYGADPTVYTTTVNNVADALHSSLPNELANFLGYASSAANRTIWLTLDNPAFNLLFGTDLLKVTDGGGGHVYGWTGSLSLPDSVASAIKGIWVDQGVTITNPNPLATAGITLQPGPLGIGNATTDKVTATPTAIADNYHFPLAADVPTGAVALVEGNINNQADLFTAYNQYRQAIGLPAVTDAQFRVVSGTNFTGDVSSELTLDISVVAGAAPNSSQLLYSYLGGTPYNAYQQIFFDSVNAPKVLSSSYPVVGQPTSASPFQWAFQQLFVDGVLANVSVHMAGGDEGASDAIANGIANVANTHSSPWTMIVGGTSIADLWSAIGDTTLATSSDPSVAPLLQLALQDDPATVFALVAAGLRTLPSTLSAAAPSPAAAATTLTTLFETVWQALAVTQGTGKYAADLEVGYGAHQTGSGGFINVVPAPSYQQAFGLNALGRSLPDVSALSSGDAFYSVLNDKYVNDLSKHHDDQPLLRGNGGTSAASPLWAALTAQFNAVFADQDLPNLGYYNDLLYAASVIAPGSFNDIQLGNNINSFYTTTYDTGYINSNLGLYMVPTGHGYSATPGFDLATGLGTPNGLLLGRALSAIAHSQVSFSTSPPLLDADGSGWQSGADQALLFQTTGNGATVHLDLGGDATLFSSAASSNLSWTSRLAQQSLQADFDPGLVLLFDKQAQGSVSYARTANNEGVAVTIDGVAGSASQASLSNPFGFADFFGSGDAVRVARPVAIAETVGGQSDQLAVLRLRQGGENNLQLTVYKVDDLVGTIDGLAPGHAGYAAAVQGRAYHTVSGAGTIAGPGYGQFNQTLLQGVDAGDIIAMRLDNLTTGGFYWAFANANEKVNGQPVGHLWNYGLNTWGWEDTHGGGDHDYNDLVVQFDFTSAYGHRWLV
jgi:hypothetical protein